MRKTYNDMRAMKRVVAASDLGWTFVRPGRLLDEPAAGGFRVEDAANPDGGRAVSRHDVADFAVQYAIDNLWHFKHPTITR